MNPPPHPLFDLAGISPALRLFLLWLANDMPYFFLAFHQDPPDKRKRKRIVETLGPVHN